MLQMLCVHVVCYHEALRFYEPLQQVAEFADASHFDAMGTCYQALELYNEAEDCYKIVVENESENIHVYTNWPKCLKVLECWKEPHPTLTKLVPSDSKSGLLESSRRVSHDLS